jgi:SAM-dependent methyltransferase
MSTDLRQSYRQRIYQGYVTERGKPLAPETQQGLRPRLTYLYKMVRQHFPKDKNVEILELGCGHGALLHVLHEAGYSNARGVDGSPEQVAAARKLGIGKVEQGDVIKVLQAQTANSIDVVVAFDLIEHFSKDELIELVDEVHRVLRPGGTWIIHVPNAESPFGGRMRHWDYTHELAFTRISIAQLLKSSGFSDIRCFEDRPIPHGVKSAVRAALWAVIRVGLLTYVAIETGSIDRQAVFSQNMLVTAYREMSRESDK